VPGVVAGALKLALACDGSVTVVYADVAGLHAATLAGVPGTGPCNGQPGPGPWGAAVTLSASGSGAGLHDVAINDAGAILAVWQEGVAGNPTAVRAALRPAGGTWGAAETVSLPNGHATWNPKPGLDAAGNAAVGYLDGYSMVVARRPAAGGWATPVLVSGNQSVYYPAFAMSAAGDMLAAWEVLDANNVGSIWQSTAPAGSGFGAATRLSAPADSSNWPSASYASDGSVALVAWVDNASNTSRAATWSAGAWRRTALGAGWWGGVVSVGAGAGQLATGWAVPAAGNPNSATLVGRGWH
jgi:hypothetical protein